MVYTVAGIYSCMISVYTCTLIVYTDVYIHVCTCIELTARLQTELPSVFFITNHGDCEDDLMALDSIITIDIMGSMRLRSDENTHTTPFMNFIDRDSMLAYKEFCPCVSRAVDIRYRVEYTADKHFPLQGQ